MLTVEDFKCLAGGVVAGDDLCQNPTPVEVEWAKYINNTPDFDHFTFKSFAWRPLNTLPDNPRFEYEQDDDKGLWRPLLDQSTLKPVSDAAVANPSDDKPVFTQEMACRGELHPVGSTVIFDADGNSDYLNEYELGLSDGDGVDIAGGMYGEGTTIWIKSVASKMDKLTEQNKLLREALSLVVDKTPMNQNIYGGGYMLLLSHDDCRILRETLNISELN